LGYLIRYDVPKRRQPSTNLGRATAQRSESVRPVNMYNYGHIARIEGRTISRSKNNDLLAACHDTLLPKFHPNNK